MFIHKWNDPCLPSSQSPATEHHCPMAGTHFPSHDPAEGKRLSGPGWLAYTKVVCPAKDVVTLPDTIWAWCTLTSLIETNASPLQECIVLSVIGGDTASAATFGSKKRARSNDVTAARMPRAKRKCGLCGEEGKLSHTHVTCAIA